MESVPLLGILSSWEFIVACLMLMLLLPLVFAVASRQSPVRRPPVPRRARRSSAAPGTRVKRPPQPAVESEETPEDET